MPELTLDGRTVTYVDQGGGSRPPLLLVHGFTGSRHSFAPVLDELAADRRVVAADLPGHGESAGPDEPAGHGLAAVAGWVLRFADALDLGDLHLLGHSMGGLVVQRVALVASQRLRSLILADTGLGAPREEIAEEFVRMAVAAREQGVEAAWEEVLRIDAERGRPPATPEQLAVERERFLALSATSIVGEASALVGATPVGAFLRGVDVPVLVLHGEDDDSWTPAEQALLARTVRGAELAVIPDAAHSPQRENPDAWLKIVGEFLRRADAT